jgi:hypothetical protein
VGTGEGGDVEEEAGGPGELGLFGSGGGCHGGRG